MAYKSKSLINAKNDHAAAEQARQRLVQRDNEISARITEMQQDMAAHLVHTRPLPIHPYLSILLHTAQVQTSFDCFLHFHTWRRHYPPERVSSPHLSDSWKL